MANVTIQGTLTGVGTTSADIGHVTYLPADNTPSTIFPKQTGKDFWFQIRQIEEKWKRMFPLLPYSMLRSAPTAQVTPGDYNTPTGTGTLIDPLYLEPVPALTTVDSLYDPQLAFPNSGGAANPKQFHDPVNLNVAVRRQAKDLQLKQWGFDEMRDCIAVVPLSLLDKAHVRVKVGDEFDYGADERFEVLQYNIVGYFKNATSRLFLVMNCQSLVRGS